MDERRNAEHYMDMTAYLAIQNAERELGMYPKAGEIWTVEKNGIEKTVVVVAAHDEYYTVLQLDDRQKNPYDIKITARSVMYTDPGMLAYQYHTYFDRLIYTLPDREFAGFLGAVADALCIKADDQSDELEAKEAEINSLKDMCGEYSELVGRLRKEIEALGEELEGRQTPGEQMAAIRAERDVYKTLYEQTVAALIENRKGA